ncbi:hypothetical protein H106_06712 [Trichophyton rubrum CBS 735.88]|nr:hypothetical protein H106_06712 [Trichophyton rubrum CBS 735.88]
MDFARNDLPRRSHYLCLPLHCTTHQLGTVEDCNSLVEDLDITMEKLLNWNPMINSNCTNLDSWRGWHLCTSTTPYREDGSSKLPERKLPTPPTPDPLAPGTIESCYRYENLNEEESARDASLNWCTWWATKGEVKLEVFLARNPSTASDAGKIDQLFPTSTAQNQIRDLYLRLRFRNGNVAAI